MPRKPLEPDQIDSLKFSECESCQLVLTRACRSCTAGELFEDADEPEDTFEFMSRFG